MSAFALLFSLAMVAANAFFVAFEFALVASKRGELDEMASKGHKTAQRALRQIDEMDGYLAACQFGITLTSLALTAVFEPAVYQALTPLLGDLAPQIASAVSIVIAVGFATVFQVIFGELFPKAVAITIPIPVLLATSRLMEWAYVLSTPLNVTYNRAANWMVRVLTGKSVNDVDEAQPLDGELLKFAYEQGRIDNEQRELMHAILEFPTRTAREVMTPANQVVGFQVDQDAQSVYQVMKEKRHTRYLIFQGEEPVGYVLMHDVFRQRIYNRFELAAITRELPRVPETTHLDRLYADYREYPIMAVYDERNEFVGIVTAQDLREEVVGPIVDEDQEPARPVVQRQTPTTVLIDGRALAEEVCEEIGLQCEMPDGVDTFGGLLLSRLGREPQPGDVVRMPPWTFTVRECEGFSIRLVEGRSAPGAQSAQEATA